MARNRLCLAQNGPCLAWPAMEAVAAVVESMGLGVADDATKSRSGGCWKGEEAVVDREQELTDDVDCRVAEEEVEVAGDGTVEGVLEGDDGAISGAVLEGGEGYLHVGAGKEGRMGGGGVGLAGGLLVVGAPDALLGNADWAALAAERGGQRVVASAEDLAVPKEALEGHLEAKAGGEVLGTSTTCRGPQILVGQHGGP